jgi:mono/diheme cytochrome c family protein
MKKTTFRSVTLVLALLTSGSVLADAASDPGKREFDANCATCHGLSGKGDGPMQSVLNVKPADLTTIAKRNNGVFPVAKLRSVIDGRMEVNSHGSRTMPVWGDDYTAQAGNTWPNHMDVAYNPEIFVRSRIMALVDYIARIQEK